MFPCSWCSSLFSPLFIDRNRGRDGHDRTSARDGRAAASSAQHVKPSDGARPTGRSVSGGAGELAGRPKRTVSDGTTTAQVRALFLFCEQACGCPQYKQQLGELACGHGACNKAQRQAVSAADQQHSNQPAHSSSLDARRCSRSGQQQADQQCRATGELLLCFTR